jgi:dihydrolipoamide dehydrogenase
MVACVRTLEVDVAIIGAGTAGITARRSALRHGAKRVVVIERGPLGTTCARVGCMPSKLLIAAAEAAHGVNAASTFGVQVAPASIDGRAVMQRVQLWRDRFVAGVVRDIETWPDEEKLTGSARFVGPDVLEVGDHTRVKARSIVIAAGSHPFVPDVLEGLGDRLVTSDGIFERDSLPSSVAVVGTGAIGLELGQALHRLGVRTKLLSATDLLGPLRDPKLVAEARRVFADELDLELGIALETARRTESGVELAWKTADGEAQRSEVELVLCAAGRRSNVDGLDLEAAGLELDERGLPKHDPRTMQCGDRPIFIGGDFTGERAVLHEAADAGRHAGANAATFPQVRAYERKTPLSIVFCDPQMAVVGTPGQRGDAQVACGEVDYRAQGRARVMERAKGHVRIWGEVTGGKITGAEMLGPGVEHTAHLLAWAIQLELTVGAALHLPYYHPVLEEGIRTAFADLAAKLRLAPARGPLDCGPGD